jgi:signal transduction histidine kinase
MPTNLRLMLGIAFSLMLVLLGLGSGFSIERVAQLQHKTAQLNSSAHATLEHVLFLSTLQQVHAGVPGAQEALTPVIATLRDLTDPDATALAAALAQVQRTPNDPTAIAEAQRSAARYRDAQIARATALSAALNALQPAGLYSIFAVLIIGCIGAGSSWLVAQAVRKPLNQLSAALDAVGRGNLNAPFPIRLPGEFKPLGDAYRNMVSALINRQNALDEELHRTAILTRLSIELRETFDPDTIAAGVLNAAGTELGGDEALLILLDANNTPQQGFHWRAGELRAADPETIRQRGEYGVEGWAWRSGRSLTINDLAVHSLWRAGGGAPSGSAMVLPIRQKGASLGSLSIVAHEPERFTMRDLTLLEGIAAQAAVAFGAARRYQEEHERHWQAIALLTTSQFLTVERGATDLAELFNDQCQSIFGASYARLYLVERPDAPPTAVALPAATLTADQCALTDQAAAVACRDRLIAIHTAPPPAEPCTVLALPLLYAGQILGAGVIVRPAEHAANLSANLWSLLTVFTSLITTATANMRLVERLREQATTLADQVEQRTEELRHSRDLLRIVFDNLSEGLLLLAADGTVLAANQAFCRSIAGRRPQAIVGTNYVALWEDLAHQSDLRLETQRPPEESQTPPLVPEPGEPLRANPATWHVLGTDFVGQQRWYAVERNPINQRADQFLERWRDITAQEELQRRMLLHEQLTSLGRLAASVAHEVGNPLQSAMSCLELCVEDAKQSERSREYLHLALGELERMGRTLASLRSLYRPPQTVWEQVDLNVIAQLVVQFTQRQLQRTRITVTMTLDPTLPLIWGQPDALRQVLLNLLLNAQEAMPAGGTITIVTRRKATDRVCELSIHDDGVGMTPEQAAHVFEPFRSYKAQGVGLGLALSRQIMEQHAGHITLTSTAGKGTTVTLYVPWIDAGHAGEQPPNSGVCPKDVR